ncbi:hypothetical protein [Achromobacter phage Motura]|uniref:Uncharacterized protein n=1 Tax=Achromobacter phage Motura TaxID=2591403 RepID=A0A514CTB9_9CAUD|nr:hypothetical protein H1O15_gp104 [Achromobacter phage Motura]QDH83728.1 hypothetical protein [Achromobacter phage Motura]
MSHVPLQSTIDWTKIPQATIDSYIDAFMDDTQNTFWRKLVHDRPSAPWHERETRRLQRTIVPYVDNSTASVHLQEMREAHERRAEKLASQVARENQRAAGPRAKHR